MDGVVLVLLCLVVCVNGYRNGKVTDSCSTLMPGHNGKPQTSTSPFTVATDQTNYPVGQDIIVHLTASSSNTFEGFLLQAREVGTSSPVGSFVTIPEGTQKLTCNSIANSAVSHSTSAAKSSIQVIWRPAASFNQTIQFHATFVQTYDTFWVDVTGPVLKVTGSGGSNSTSEPFSGTSTILPGNVLSLLLLFVVSRLL